jgi:ATP-dependent Clp protease ATP-binding subunit ClpA
VILFVDEIHSLFANSASGSGPADLLKTALGRGEVQVLGTTTPAEYKKNIEKDSALSRLFAALPVEAPDEDQAIAMCRGIVERYEVHHGVRITDPAVVAAVKLSKRYLSGASSPTRPSTSWTRPRRSAASPSTRGRSELDSLARQLSALEAQHRSLVDEDDAASRRGARGGGEEPRRGAPALRGAQAPVGAAAHRHRRVSRGAGEDPRAARGARQGGVASARRPRRRSWRTMTSPRRSAPSATPRRPSRAKSPCC